MVSIHNSEKPLQTQNEISLGCAYSTWNVDKNLGLKIMYGYNSCHLDINMKLIQQEKRESG
jgi:hypothetical protein